MKWVLSLLLTYIERGARELYLNVRGATESMITHV